MTQILVGRKCSCCKQAMYIEVVDTQVTMTGCDPIVVNLRISEDTEKGVYILSGNRSEKKVECSNCYQTHMISTFEEVKT